MPHSSVKQFESPLRADSPNDDHKEIVEDGLHGIHAVKLKVHNLIHGDVPQIRDKRIVNITTEQTLLHPTLIEAHSVLHLMFVNRLHVSHHTRHVLYLLIKLDTHLLT